MWVEIFPQSCKLNLIVCLNFVSCHRFLLKVNLERKWRIEMNYNLSMNSRLVIKTSTFKTKLQDRDQDWDFMFQEQDPGFCVPDKPRFQARLDWGISHLSLSPTNNRKRREKRERKKKKQRKKINKWHTTSTRALWKKKGTSNQWFPTVFVLGPFSFLGGPQG